MSFHVLLLQLWGGGVSDPKEEVTRAKPIRTESPYHEPDHRKFYENVKPYIPAKQMKLPFMVSLFFNGCLIPNGFYDGFTNYTHYKTEPQLFWTSNLYKILSLSMSKETQCIPTEKSFTLLSLINKTAENYSFLKQLIGNTFNMPNKEHIEHLINDVEIKETDSNTFILKFDNNEDMTLSFKNGKTYIPSSTQSRNGKYYAYDLRTKNFIEIDDSDQPDAVLFVSTGE